MTESEPEVPESPATWENVVVGELKKVVGKVLHDEALTEEGEEQKEIAHEVHRDWEDEQRA